MEHNCSTCTYHLGAGFCRLNVEMECAEGGGFELWERRNESTWTNTKAGASSETQSLSKP